MSVPKAVYASQQAGLSFNLNASKENGSSGGKGNGGDYMSNFKSLLISSPTKQASSNAMDEDENSPYSNNQPSTNSSKTKNQSKSGGYKEADSSQKSPIQPNAADILLKKKPTAESERENAERVDALLMDLFPERFQKPEAKKGKTKGKKVASLASAAVSSVGSGGYNKNQVRHFFFHIK